MRPLSEMLTWVGSHSKRLARPGYTPPNHLANATVRFYGKDGMATFGVMLDENGTAPDYTHDPPPQRVEIYDAQGNLLFAEDA